MAKSSAAAVGGFALLGALSLAVGYIFYFDPVNEEAAILKCKALSSLGKHSLAKHTFESFMKEYKVIYGEDFKKDFHDILE